MTDVTFLISACTYIWIVKVVTNAIAFLVLRKKTFHGGITHEKSVGSLAGGHLVAVNRCRVADTGMKTKTNRNTDRNENSCADSDKNPNV